MSASTAIDFPGVGIHAGIPLDAYHAMPGVSRSQLANLSNYTPAKAKWRNDHGIAVTAAMRLGSAAHTCVLEHDEWEDGFVCGVDGPLNKNPWKKDQADLIEANPDKTVLKASEYDACQAMRRRIMAHPKARKLCTGQAERSIWWEDPETGVLCKCRPDMISDNQITLGDLKVTANAAHREWSRVAFDKRYDLQDVHYLAGASAAGLPHRLMGFVVIEPTPPYDLAVRNFPADYLSLVADEHRRLLFRWKACEESGEWPSYPERAEEIDVPDWRYRRLEEAL